MLVPLPIQSLATVMTDIETDLNKAEREAVALFRRAFGTPESWFGHEAIDEVTVDLGDLRAIKHPDNGRLMVSKWEGYHPVGQCIVTDTWLDVEACR